MMEDDKALLHLKITTNKITLLKFRHLNAVVKTMTWLEVAGMVHVKVKVISENVAKVPKLWYNHHF